MRKLLSFRTVARCKVRDARLFNLPIDQLEIRNTKYKIHLIYSKENTENRCEIIQF
jgi:hypothetical protein